MIVNAQDYYNNGLYQDNYGTGFMGGGQFIDQYNQGAYLSNPSVGQIVSGGVLPGQVMPGQIIQGQVLTNPMVQGQVVTGQMVQGQLVPGQVVSGQVVPGQVIPLANSYNQGVISNPNVVQVGNPLVSGTVVADPYAPSGVGVVAQQVSVPVANNGVVNMVPQGQPQFY